MQGEEGVLYTAADQIDGLFSAELVRVDKLRDVYAKWKDQREWTWFYTDWLRAPHYPIKLKQGSTYDRKRLEQILKDFGFKAPVFSGTRRGVTLPAEDIRVLQKKLVNLTRPAIEMDPIVVTLPPPSSSSSPSPLGQEEEERCAQMDVIEKTLEKVKRDMTALTQERDKLRAMLEQAQAELRQAAAAAEKPLQPPVPTAPLPPTPPPSVAKAPLPQPTVPSVTKPELSDLLKAIQQGKTLKKAAEKAPLLPEAAKKGPASFADQLAAKFKNARAQKEEEEDSDNDFAAGRISCEMCYSAPISQCVQCRRAFYCSSDCQARHWHEGGHKHSCA